MLTDVGWLTTQALTRTRALKRRVDDLRRERLVFNDLLRKLGTSCDAARSSALQSLKHIHHANVARDRVRSWVFSHSLL